MAKTHFFYVLHCGDGSLYAGYTVDLQRRLTAHRQGRGAKYTRSRTPLDLIYAEAWPTQSLAMRQEALFKQLTRPQKEAYLSGQGVQAFDGSGFVLVHQSHDSPDIKQGGGSH